MLHLDMDTGVALQQKKARNLRNIDALCDTFLEMFPAEGRDES